MDKGHFTPRFILCNLSHFPVGIRTTKLDVINGFVQESDEIPDDTISWPKTVEGKHSWDGVGHLSDFETVGRSKSHRGAIFWPRRNTVSIDCRGKPLRCVQANFLIANPTEVFEKTLHHLQKNRVSESTGLSKSGRDFSHKALGGIAFFLAQVKGGPHHLTNGGPCCQNS